MSPIETTQQASQAMSGHPVLSSAARHTKRGGLMMAILGRPNRFFDSLVSLQSVVWAQDAQRIIEVECTASLTIRHEPRRQSHECSEWKQG